MPLIESAPAREMDPLQSVLLHLPGGMYGSYQALCDYMSVDPTVPEPVKEGLRFLSAIRVGCAFCVTVRLDGAAGDRLLEDPFYEWVLAGRTDWETVAPSGWDAVFLMADEVLRDGVISSSTGELLNNRHTDAEIVQSLFYLLLIGASHRFSKALGLEAVCSLPTRIETGTSTVQLGSALSGI